MELVDDRRIPPGNRPGAARRERDHPDVPHDVWTTSHGEGVAFPFRFEGAAGAMARVAGCRPDHGVRIAHDELVVRYGPWVLRTPVENLLEATVTGPYHLLKVGLVPHLSLADRGITFATSTRAGVCLRFDEPVPAALPHGVLRHPGATVTVADPDGLVRVVRDLVEAHRGAGRER